jgi:hypothetical protein
MSIKTDIRTPYQTLNYMKYVEIENDSRYPAVTEEAKKKYLAALHIAEDEEYETGKYYAKFGGRVVGPYDTEKDAYHDTKGDAEWVKKGEDINVKMESFKFFFESKDADIKDLKKMIKNPDPSKVKEYGGMKYINMLKKKLAGLEEEEQVKVRKGGAGKAFYTSTRVEKDKKKEQSKKQARGKVKPEDAEDRCKRKADSVYGKKTSAYKSGAIVRCRDGKIWKK